MPWMLRKRRIMAGPESASMRRAVAVCGELEAADRAAGEQADDHRDHRRDEPAQRPAEDDDDAMLFGAATSRPTSAARPSPRRSAPQNMPAAAASRP